MKRILLLAIALAGMASAQSGPLNSLALSSSGSTAVPFAQFVLITDAVADSTVPGHYVYRSRLNLWATHDSLRVDTLWFEVEDMRGLLSIRSLRILRGGQEVVALNRWERADSSLWVNLPGCPMVVGPSPVWLRDSLCDFTDSAHEANGDTIGRFGFCKERILSHSHSSTSPFNVDTAATLYSGDTVEIDVKSPPPLGPTGVTSRQGMEKRTQAQPGRLYDIRGRRMSGGPTVAGVVIGLCNGSVTRAVDLRAARTGSPNIALERQIGGQ